MKILVHTPRGPSLGQKTPGPFKQDGDSEHQYKENEKEWHLNDTSEATVSVLHGPYVVKQIGP